MTKKRKQKRQKRRQRITVSGEIARVLSPRARLYRPFKILDEVIATAYDARREIGNVKDYEQFQKVAFNRALNSLQAIKILLQQDHWEGAVAISRQLLELSLNLERIFVIEENQEAAVRKFIRFGLLQQSRHVQVRERLARKSNYAENQNIEEMVDDKILATNFAEFLEGKRQNGSLRWKETWCGKTARTMTQESTLEEREDQYELFYRSWSEQIHAAPGSMMFEIFSTAEAGWIKDALQKENQNVIETLANSVSIFFEIWSFLPIFHASFNVGHKQELMNELKNLD